MLCSWCSVSCRVAVFGTLFKRFLMSGLEDAGREALEEQLRWVEDDGGTVSGASSRSSWKQGARDGGRSARSGTQQIEGADLVTPEPHPASRARTSKRMKTDGLEERAVFVAAVEEVGADPIFLGAEDISGLEHALMGGVCEEALRHANRTALVVRGRPEGEGLEEGP
jgi:nucleotide-binding universal stress UspA family protein